MTDTLTRPTLPTFSWIGHLKDDDRELLSSYGEFFPGHPGNIIIEEGAMQTEVFVVISGKLEVRAKQDDGSEILLAQIGPGETLGEISLFNPGPAAATVTAVEFSQLWRIADADLIHFMEENPGAGNVLLRTLASILAQRLRQMNPRAFGLSTYAVIESPELAQQAPAPAVEPEKPPTPDATILPPPPPAEQLKRASATAPPQVSPTSQGKKVPRKTQVVPDPDELESL
jgi:CRP/FNR family transcriptional regulator, cyclic AMP receptor protein